MNNLQLAGFANPITTRGYTGHEMVDEMGIIHMNGRIYDPRLARFLQADPYIQAATNTQSYNRYSYVLNNPLNSIDPSGFFSFKSEYKKMMHGVAIHKWLDKYIPWAVPIIQIAMNFIPGGGPFYSAAFGANHAYYLSGGKESAGIKSFAISMASYGAFKSIGDAFSGANCSGCYAANGAGALGASYTAGAFAAKVFAHAIVGGVMSVLQGGEFGHGFAAAGFAQAFSGAIDGIGGSKLDSTYYEAGNRALRITVAAIVGGTASSITGGKFANGAITGAFSRAFNDEAHHNKLAKQQYEKQKVIAYSKAGVQGGAGVVTVISGTLATGAGIAACLVAEPCGLIMIVGGVTTMGLGAVAVHDAINDVQNFDNGTSHLPFAARMGEAFGGDTGRSFGEMAKTAVDSVLLTKSAASLSVTLATGKTINYVELVDSANTIHNITFND